MSNAPDPGRAIWCILRLKNNGFYRENPPKTSVTEKWQSRKTRHVEDFAEGGLNQSGRNRFLPVSATLNFDVNSLCIFIQKKCILFCFHVKLFSHSVTKLELL